MYEYTSDVFAVGLEGFAPVDNDKIGRMAAEGWEPAHMTTVHNGFAAVVLFRRERAGALAPPARVRKAAGKKAASPATRAARQEAPAAKAAGPRRTRAARPR